MDRPGFKAGGFRHALGRPACGSRQQDIQAAQLKIADNGIDRRRLSCSGAACDNKEAAVDRFYDRLHLKLVQLNVLLLLNRLQALSDGLLRLIPRDIQIVKHFGRVQLCVVILGGVNQLSSLIRLFLPGFPASIQASRKFFCLFGRFFVRSLFPAGFLPGSFHHQTLFHLHVHEAVLNFLRIHAQKLRGLGCQNLLRKVCMAVSRRPEKRIQNSALDSEIGVRQNSGPGGNLIRHLKADSRNVVRQLVGILLNNPVHGRAVFPVDFRRQIHGHAVVLKEHHGLAHIPLFLDLLPDGHGHLFADPLDLGQTLRLLLHDSEGVFLKFFNYP